MRFFVGLHKPWHSGRFERAFISVNVLRRRVKPIKPRDWILDCGAFTSVARDGGYSEGVEVYANQIEKWRHCGKLLAAVSQDYMCEPFVRERTGLSVSESQILTIERYLELMRYVDRMRTGPRVYIMPVLQGYGPSEYAHHVKLYRSLLPRSAWVGVGSVCKRNANVSSVEAVLLAIKRVRPDLRLHAFGLKLTALSSPLVRELLESADSMAWSYNARRNGRNQNCWKEARRFVQRVESLFSSCSDGRKLAE